jgi:hypothetical protein
MMMPFMSWEAATRPHKQQTLSFRTETYYRRIHATAFCNLIGLDTRRRRR